MHKKIGFGLALSVAVGMQPAIADTAWSQVVVDDINHIYSTVGDNHPGYIDNENPYFREWLEKGYKEAMEQAETAQSLDDVLTILHTYVAGFGDGHFSLNLNHRRKYLYWAGMQIKKFGGDYRVSYADSKHTSNMPMVMSRLVSCDGRGAENIIVQDVLKYRFNTPQLDFPKVSHAPRILSDDGIGNRTQFKACDFEEGGEIKSYPLAWKKISYTRYLDKVRSKSGGAKGYKFEPFGDNEYWVTLPKFYPNSEEQKALRNVIAEIAKVQGSATQFVIDVRGNGGGNSQWGVEIAKALYGDAYIDYHRTVHSDNSYALWRASTENLNYLNSLLPTLRKQFDEDSEILVQFSALTSRMKAALEDGKELIRQSEEEAGQSKGPAGPWPAPAGKAKILFLTDNRCGSACLDFADLMLKLPNVHHIGQETGADTVYMDIRSIQLPSGLGRYSLAQKVYRGRTRAHNESYKPAYFYNGDLSDTGKVKEWIAGLEIKN